MKLRATAPAPDETFEMTFAKDNAAEDGFNRWTINGAAYPMTSEIVPAPFHLRHGKRYRLRMRNASDDIHPIHLHRHSFELTSLAGKPTAGILKDVVMLGGYQEAEVDVVADIHDKSLSRGQKLSRRASEERVHKILRCFSSRSCLSAVVPLRMRTRHPFAVSAPKGFHRRLSL